jgi:hypothetical protein
MLKPIVENQQIDIGVNACRKAEDA